MLCYSLVHPSPHPLRSVEPWELTRWWRYKIKKHSTFLQFEFHIFDSNNDLPVQLPMRFEYSLCGSAYSGFGRFAGGSAGSLSTLNARLRFEIRIDCQGRVCRAGIVTIMRISCDGKLGLWTTQRLATHDLSKYITVRAMANSALVQCLGQARARFGSGSEPFLELTNHDYYTFCHQYFIIPEPKTALTGLPPCLLSETINCKTYFPLLFQSQLLIQHAVYCYNACWETWRV